MTMTHMRLWHVGIRNGAYFLTNTEYRTQNTSFQVSAGLGVDVLHHMSHVIGSWFKNSRCWIMCPLFLSSYQPLAIGHSHPCEESTGSLFKLVSLESADSSIFSFSQIWGKSDSRDRALIRIQCSLMHEWIEGFKSLTPNKLTPAIIGKVLKHLAFADNYEVIGMRPVKVGLVRAGFQQVLWYWPLSYSWDMVLDIDQW